MDSFSFSLLKYWRPTGLVTASATSPDTDTDDEGEDGSFFELEITSFDRSVSDTEISDSDPKSPVSLLKSATRFRVFAMGGLRKLKPDPNAFFIEVFRSSKQSKPEGVVPEEKRFVVHKYISKIKPLYIRVSRRYGEKLRFSGPLTADGGDAKGAKQLVKSRSAVAEVSLPPVAQRRDDSLLQQEDGIQSAIAHCKRSLIACSKETKTSLVNEGEEKIM